MFRAGRMAYEGSCTIGGAVGDDDGWTTLVVRVFPIEEAFLRLILAILMMSSEEWECSRLYIRMESC